MKKIILDTKKSLEDLLQNALQGEYQQWDLYYTYKSVLKGPFRESIAEHFSEHAVDEAEHIDMVQRFLVGLGYLPTTERRPIPAIDEDKIHSWEEIVRLQLKYEQEAVETYTAILKELGETNAALRIELENVLVKEQEHVHDLLLLLGE